MRVEWLILADFAQVIDNKLYLQGGGWDKLTVNTGFPFVKHVGIATSIVVPWTETNREGKVKIEVLTQDGLSLGKMEGTFKVGRPAELPEGVDQRAQIAVSVPLSIKKEGIYVVVAELEGEEKARVHFNVVPGPMLVIKSQIASEGKPPSEERGDSP